MGKPNRNVLALVPLVAASLAAGPPAPVASVPGPRALAAAGTPTREEVLDRFARSWADGLSGDLVFMGRPGVCFTGKKYPHNHGSAWDYDSHVPLFLFGPGQVRRVTRRDPDAQPLDLPATLAATVGIEPPPGNEGRAWTEVLARRREPPRALLLCVMDQVGEADLERFAAHLPTMTRWRREGARFTRSRWRQLPTFTGVSHASIGTGAPPVVHGVAQNFIPNADRTGMRVIFREADGEVDPSFHRVPTFADWLDLQLGNKPVVITQIYADYAAVGLGGRGAAFPGGDPDVVVWYDGATGRPTTDRRYFRLPEYLARRSVFDRRAALAADRERAVAAAPAGTKVPGLEGRDVQAFPAFARWEADNLLLAMEREGVGRDGVPDLVQVNLKSTDAVGHSLGHDHPTYLECLVEVDRFLAAAERYLDATAGRGRWLAAVTADHGLPPDDRAIRYNEELAARVGAALDEAGDRDGKTPILSIDGYHVYLDRAEAREDGAAPDRIRDLLAADPDVWAAWTAREVEARVGRAPARPDR